MTLHLDVSHKFLKSRRLYEVEGMHKIKMKAKKVARKANAALPYTPEPDVEFIDIKELKASRGRMGDHSGYRGVELRAIRREKGVGRPA